MKIQLVSLIFCLMFQMLPNLSFASHDPYITAQNEGELGETCPKGSKPGAPEWRINKINSNLYISDIPLWYAPAIGPAMTARLSYNSKAKVTGNEAFGNKWIFQYGGNIRPGKDGSIIVTMADGREDTFVSEESGNYAPKCDCRTYMDLRKVDESHFELVTNDGTTYTYASPNSDSSRICLSEIRDVNNLKLTLGYSNHRLTTLTDAVGKVSSLHYRGDGLVEKITDPFGRQALFSYDDHRNLTGLTDMGGYATTLSYGEDSIIKSLTNKGGRTEFIIEASTTLKNAPPEDIYPAPGGSMKSSSRITVVHPDNSREEFFYNGYSTTGWYVSPQHYRHHSEAENNLSDDVPKTIYTYADTAKGWRSDIASITTANGEKTSYQYDSDRGRITSVADADNNTIRLEYNRKGQITKYTAPNGAATTIRYAENEVDPVAIATGLGVIRRTYNDRHQPTSQTDLAGQTTNYTYNEYGQITSITAPPADATEFIYTNEHHLGEISRSGQSLFSFTYDALGRVVTRQDSTGLLVNYSYDNLNHITTTSYPDGKTETYRFSSVRTTPPPALTVIKMVNFAN